MTWFWLRAESRANEARAPLLPEGAARLVAAGHRLTVEESPRRVVSDARYRAAGAEIASPWSWPNAPAAAVILGLKELPPDDAPLCHRHVMFGHAFKGQHAGPALLARFAEGGGTLLDLEYLVDEAGRRLAAFGYWAGHAGAAVSLLASAAQAHGATCPPVTAWLASAAMRSHVAEALAGVKPTAIVIGARGRVGIGARDLLQAHGISPTLWDVEETARGAPFPEIARHQVFLNCVLARPGTPVFAGPALLTAPRSLRVIGDVACDPDSDYNPVPLYDRATSWEAPVTRVHGDPPLDVMAIDNLPSLLPRESSEDFAGQLLPLLLAFDDDPGGVWARAEQTFRKAL